MFAKALIYLPIHICLEWRFWIKYNLISLSQIPEIVHHWPHAGQSSLSKITATASMFVFVCSSARGRFPHCLKTLIEFVMSAET
jgi:hypothetical protein